MPASCVCPPSGSIELVTSLPVLLYQEYLVLIEDGVLDVFPQRPNTTHVEGGKREIPFHWALVESKS